MAANDVFGIHQLHLQHRRQISELTARCHELAEAQAEAQRASAAEICLLKSQVNELKNQVEIFRADGRQAAAEAACRPFPISGLTRIASGADSRGNTAVADTCNPLAFVNTSGAAAYPDHIPLEDREAIRSRMLRDRGPQERRELQQPSAVDTQAATHESCLPSSSGPAGSEPSLPEDGKAKSTGFYSFCSTHATGSFLEMSRMELSLGRCRVDVSRQGASFATDRSGGWQRLLFVASTCPLLEENATGDRTAHRALEMGGTGNYGLGAVSRHTHTRGVP